MRYSDVSKLYVFVGEQKNGSITEFESRDVNFIENKFLKLGEIGRDQAFYETQDLNASGSLHSSRRIIDEEENENVVHSQENENVILFSQSDVNVQNPKLSGRMDPNSSESIDFEPGWIIPNHDEY